MSDARPETRLESYALQHLYENTRRTLESFDELQLVSEEWRAASNGRPSGARLKLLKAICAGQINSLSQQLDKYSAAIPPPSQTRVADIKAALSDLTACLSFSRSWEPSELYPTEADVQRLDLILLDDAEQLCGVHDPGKLVEIAREARKEIWLEHADTCRRAHEELRRLVGLLLDLYDPSSSLTETANATPRPTPRKSPRVSERESIILKILETRAPPGVGAEEVKVELARHYHFVELSTVYKDLERLVVAGKVHKTNAFRGFHHGAPLRTQGAPVI